VDLAYVYESRLSNWLKAINPMVIFSSSAGFAIAAPCTHLLGCLLVDNYKPWQPLSGGGRFVYLQAAGWTAYSIFLFVIFADVAQRIFASLPT
jgi:hypothetical protein